MDDDQVYAVNRFIPIAQDMADKQVQKVGKISEKRKGPNGYYTHCFWTEYFYAAMNRLTSDAGIRIVREGSCASF